MRFLKRVCKLRRFIFLTFLLLLLLLYAHQLQVGDKPPIRSKVVTSKAASRDSINPTFNQELWLPVTFPAMTTKVTYTLDSCLQI